MDSDDCGKGAYVCCVYIEMQNHQDNSSSLACIHILFDEIKIYIYTRFTIAIIYERKMFTTQTNHHCKENGMHIRVDGKR